MNLSLDFRSVDEHIELVYAAFRNAVDHYGEKQSDFGDDIGMSQGELSNRLGHKVKGGQLQRCYLDWIGFLALKPGAREAFLNEIATAWGYRVEPIRSLTDGERAAILGSAVTSETKRAIERERGLPKGSLG